MIDEIASQMLFTGRIPSDPPPFYPIRELA